MGQNATVLRLLPFLILLAGSLIAETYLHERAHQQIYLYHGCRNVSIRMTWEGGETACLDQGYVESMQEKALHSWNEIIGYPMLLIMILASGWIALEINLG